MIRMILYTLPTVPGYRVGCVSKIATRPPFRDFSTDSGARHSLRLPRPARHSLRVSGAVFKVSDFEGVFKVSDFAPSKMRSVRFRVVCKVSGCEMSNFRNFEPSENFEPSLRIFEVSHAPTPTQS